MSYVFGDLFAPHRLAYLSHVINVAVEHAVQRSADAVTQHEAALRQARKELDNIAAAIRQGIITPTTRQMLEETERRVAVLEQAVRDAGRRPSPVVAKSVVERYLRDLRATVETNVESARHMLSLALDKIALRREGPRLVAEVTGNYAGIFSLDGCVNSVGAGRGILFKRQARIRVL